MNILLWLLQILLALHTLAGAYWKFSHTAGQTDPTLKAIPDMVWMGMAVVELLCVLALLVPAFNKSLGKLAPAAAVFIAAEMLLYCGLNLASGAVDVGHIVYWLIVAALCAFIAYGRLVLKPI